MYKKVALSSYSRFLFRLQVMISSWIKHLLCLQITEADVEEFEANYRGSESERKDLIGLFKKYKGNMKR